MTSRDYENFTFHNWWFWIVGFLAFLWVVLRTGMNPKRLTYPCQQAAFPLASSWMFAIISIIGARFLLKKYLKLSCAVLLLAAVMWLFGPVADRIDARRSSEMSLPVWEVSGPISRVFVLDDIPPSPGSLDRGDATVPDEYLRDPAIETLMSMLAAKGVLLHKSAAHPTGFVGPDHVVIIKGNFQWTGRNTTNTDRIKGLIWHILQHPEGFRGEILVCDNTQEIGTGINDADNNSDDLAQSIPDIVNTFRAKGYPVASLDWNSIWSTVASEYSNGDGRDGYVYDNATKVSYPKFRSPSGKHFISMRHGIWNPEGRVYDASKLCIIDFPVLKAHSLAGATIAVKNWVGMLTTAYADERYGGRTAMHNTYFFSPYALVARVMAETFPQLTIVDATWTTTRGPSNPTAVQNTKTLVASTDPVAASWYAAKYVLTPVARYPNQTDPDRIGSSYKTVLDNWTSYFRDSAGLPCTRNAAEISVYNRDILTTHGARSAP